MSSTSWRYGTTIALGTFSTIGLVSTLCIIMIIIRHGIKLLGEGIQRVNNDETQLIILLAYFVSLGLRCISFMFSFAWIDVVPQPGDPLCTVQGAFITGFMVSTTLYNCFLAIILTFNEKITKTTCKIIHVLIIAVMIFVIVFSPGVPLSDFYSPVVTGVWCWIGIDYKVYWWITYGLILVSTVILVFVFGPSIRREPVNLVLPLVLVMTHFPLTICRIIIIN